MVCKGRRKVWYFKTQYTLLIGSISNTLYILHTYIVRNSPLHTLLQRSKLQLNECLTYKIETHI